MNTRNLIVLLAVVVLVGIALWYNSHKSMMAGHMGANPIVSNIKVPEFNAVEHLGERAFNENCAVCHGTNAGGTEGVAPPLVHKIYEPNHHGDAAFRLAAQNGVRAHHWPYGDMPPVPNVTERDVNNIIAYVRAVQRANGIN